MPVILHHDDARRGQCQCAACRSGEPGRRPGESETGNPSSSAEFSPPGTRTAIPSLTRLSAVRPARRAPTAARAARRRSQPVWRQPAGLSELEVELS